MNNNNNNNNNRNKVNNHKGSNTGNSNNKTNAQEQEQPRSFLANLFKIPDDPQQAEAERDARFGRTPRNINANSSFSK